MFGSEPSFGPARLWTQLHRNDEAEAFLELAGFHDAFHLMAVAHDSNFGVTGKGRIRQEFGEPFSDFFEVGEHPPSDAVDAGNKHKL